MRRFKFGLESTGLKTGHYNGRGVLPERSASAKAMAKATRRGADSMGMAPFGWFLSAVDLGAQSGVPVLPKRY